VSNTSPILNLAVIQNRIPSIKTEMEWLREKAGFYIADPLFEDLLKQSQSFKDQASSKNQS